MVMKMAWNDKNVQVNDKDLQVVDYPDVHPVSEEEMENSNMKLLNPKQQRFIHLYLSGDYSVKKISELLNMSYNGVRKWLNTPKIKAIIEEHQIEEDEIVKQGLKAMRLHAVYKMRDLCDSKVEGIAYQAARDILDRTGHKAPTKNETKVEIYTFEQQMAEVIKQSNSPEEFVDVEFKSSDGD